MKDRSLCQVKKATRYKRRIKPVLEDNDCQDEILYHTQDLSINDYKEVVNRIENHVMSEIQWENTKGVILF